MRKILIAVLNEEDYKEIYNYLKNEKDVQMYNKDVLYEEAIFDLIETNSYNELIISEEIISDLNKYKKIIKRGLNIQIISENECKIEYYKKHGFYNVNSKRDYIYKNFYKTQNNEDIKTEINTFKRIIEKANNAEIIAFTGERKSGKTTIAINYLSKIENKNVLYLNLNYNNDILYYFDENSNSTNKVFYREINENKITFNVFFDLKNPLFFESYIKRIDKQYEIIIIDIDYSINIKILKTIFKYCNKVFFVINPIVVEINNSTKKIERFIQERVIDNNKINIIFNKYDINSLRISILQDIFNKYKIDCVYRRRKKYRKLLNKEVKNGDRS